jgi:hypothetical protein
LIALLQSKLPDQYGEIAVEAIKLILMVLAALGIGNGIWLHKGVELFGLLG